MATLLSSHLEQISLCSASIAELPFSQPGMFTNALLSTGDITNLIRDTEQHERALFHLSPPDHATSGAAQSHQSRRATTYAARQPKNTAVAAVLGGNLYQRTRKVEETGRQKGEIDVDLLLHGAEKLANVYPISGASEKIKQLKRRHQQLAGNIAHYEGRIAEQQRELQAMNRRPSSHGYASETPSAADAADVQSSREDLEREELEIRELEMKKKSLEDRVTGMERDLGGLLR